MKLVNKLLVGFNLIIFLIIVQSSFTIYESQESQKKSIAHGSTTLSNSIMDLIDMNIYHNIHKMESLSKDYELQDMILLSNSKFADMENIMEYIQEKDSAWISAPKSEITPLMENIIENKISEQLREYTSFYKYQYGYDLFPEIIITNLYGANIAQTGKTTDYYQADEEWWQKGKSDGIFVEDVSIDESSNTTSIALGIRIEDNEGNFIGVMKAIINIEETYNLIENIQSKSEYKTASFDLLTHEGIRIYSSTNHNSEHKHFENLINSGRLYKDIPYSIEHDGKSENLIIIVKSDGYREYEGLGWIIVAEYDTKEVLSPAYSLRNKILLISIISILSAMIISFILSHNLTKPLTRLKTAVESFSHGEYEEELKISTYDEINDLASSFNSMANSLKKAEKKLHNTNKNLEKEVKKKTKELQSKVKNLERFHSIVLKRELKMIELKKENSELKRKLEEK